MLLSETKSTRPCLLPWTVRDGPLPAPSTSWTIESGLYFLTAKGQNFYGRWKPKEQIAFAAMKGEEPLSCVAVSVQGKAKEIGPDRLPDLFRKNPYMEKIYAPRAPAAPSPCFKSMKGTGEWFDLSRLLVERVRFSFGGEPRSINLQADNTL